MTATACYAATHLPACYCYCYCLLLTGGPEPAHVGDPRPAQPLPHQDAAEPDGDAGGGTGYRARQAHGEAAGRQGVWRAWGSRGSRWRLQGGGGLELVTAGCRAGSVGVLEVQGGVWACDT